jgi:hypothetical protein
LSFVSRAPYTTPHTARAEGRLDFIRAETSAGGHCHEENYGDIGFEPGVDSSLGDRIATLTVRPCPALVALIGLLLMPSLLPAQAPERRADHDINGEAWFGVWQLNLKRSV